MSKRYPGGIIRKTPQTPSQTSAQGVWDMTSVTQSVKENTWPIAGVPDPISKSLRFRASASAYLNRTPASAGNRKTWTWSGWIKRGSLSSWQIFFGAWDGVGGNDTTRLDLAFEAANTISITGGVTVFRNSTQVFRDPSAWYHIVVVADTTNATAQNRLRIYVNGVEITNWGTNNTVTQNTTLAVNNNASHVIGARGSSPTQYFDGYMTEVYLIDGQALTPSSFGNTNDQTGVWQPIAYTGTYGTNGFYLPFSNTASTTTLGYDFSGNSNNWTPNNISLTSGSTYDSMVDVPTQWIPYNTAGDTGALFRGNYAVWNPLDKGTVTVTNANLSAVSAADTHAIRASMGLPLTGKFYWETTVSGLGYGSSLGIANATSILTTGASSPETRTYQWGSWFNSFNSGIVQYGTNQTLTGGTNWSGASQLAANDVLMIAVDMDNGSMWVGKNGTWFNSSGTANPATNTDPRWTGLTGTTWFPYYSGYGSVSPVTANINFGQRPFSYTPPAGFKTLCTTNLSTPTIGATATTTANKYFDATLYTGNGSTQSITNSGSMQPDFLWIKRRDAAASHAWIDSVRGISNQLASNNTNAEATGCTDGITSLNSNGFSLGAGTIGYITNTNGASLVAWQWRASNTTAVTNTAGSITSTVSANTTAGFSIVSYASGSAGQKTVGHGLGVTPSMIITKSRDNSSYNWSIYHSSVIDTTSKFLRFTTDGIVTSATIWGASLPTSTVFGITSDNGVPANNNCIAYCFAQVAGYSAFGSYTGNGSTDGPFIYTGFRPAFVLTKITSGSGDWYMWDNKRIIAANGDAGLLYAQSSLAESDYNAAGIDLLSNGFKIRNSDNSDNGSGVTVVYAAFAESPFKYALAR